MWYNYVRELESAIRFLDHEQRGKEALPLIYQFIYLVYNIYILSGTEMEEFNVFPRTMGSPQIFLIENILKDIQDTQNFDSRYINFINASGYPKIFKGTARESLAQYKNEKRASYEELLNSNLISRLDPKLGSRLKTL